MSIKVNRADVKYFYGQVEPTKVAWGETNEIFAQLPVEKEENVLKIVENGMFGKYDRSRNCITASADSKAKWVMVFNEERLFERDTVGHYETKKDFHLSEDMFSDGKIYPRMVGTTVNDTIVTNCVATGTYTVGDLLQPVAMVAENGKNGLAILTKMTKTEADLEATDEEIWKVVKECTLPDGHDAVMIQKIQ